MKYLLLLVLILSVRAAGACDCLPPSSIKAAYQAADYVVQVRVAALRDTIHYDLYSQPVRPPFRSGYSPVLSVEKVFKGRFSVGQSITLADDGSQGMCNFYFQNGATYVVFLNKYKGGYSASPCQKHFLLTDTASLKAFRLVNK